MNFSKIIKVKLGSGLQKCRLFTFFIIWISLTLVFLRYLSEILIKLGSYIDYRSWHFNVGYFMLSCLAVGVSILLIYKKFIHNTTLTFLFFYCATVYGILRVFSESINFAPLSSNLKYADIIILCLLLHCINLWVVHRKKKRVKERERISSFFVQDSLYQAGELDNEKILLNLINVISDFKPEIAFSIGLNAIWGYGKSSFLDRFKSQYEIKNPNELVFWNRIWKNKDSVGIIENFFEELKSNLRPYSSEISDNIDSYVDSILNLSSSDFSKILSFGKKALSENTTLEKFYSGINENIKDIDKQIVVLLDDLDRLEKNEILNALKLIRTLSDFNNVVFIAGYDRRYVVDTIAMPKNNYLDKIFNVEINLLPFDEQLIINELLYQVAVAFPELEHEKDSSGFQLAFKNLFAKKNLDLVDINLNNLVGAGDKFICSNYTLNFEDFLKTYRDVKRFINEFKFNASFLDNLDDIILEEYVLLKLLTYKYRDLQYLIFSNVEEFFEHGITDDTNRKVVENAPGSANIYIYDIQGQERVKLLNHSENDFEIINATLCRLFGRKPYEFYENNLNAISKIYFTEIYIRNNIAGGQISISDLQKAYELGKLNQICEQISRVPTQSQFQITNEIKQFIYKLNLITTEQFKDVIKALNNILNYTTIADDQQSINIMSHAIKKIYNSDMEKIINDLIALGTVGKIEYFDRLLNEINMNFIRKESAIKTYSLKSYRNNPFSMADIKKFFIRKIEKAVYLNNLPDYIYGLYSLYSEAIVANRNIVKSAKTNEILRQDIEKRPLEYFLSDLFKPLTERINDNTAEFVGYSPNVFLSQIFSNADTQKLLIKNPLDEGLFAKYEEEGWNNLNSFLLEVSIEELDENTKLKVERMKKFVDEFIKNGYKPLNKIQYSQIWNDLPF